MKENTVDSAAARALPGSLMDRRGCAALWVCMLACLFSTAVWSGSAAAAETYFFNAGLSLTGDCSTSEVDLVPDPGCPGGSHPPSGAFVQPRAVTTDHYGDIYVALYGPNGSEPKEGRIDVFDANGNFLTEIQDPGDATAAAVDGEGYVYVSNQRNTMPGKLVRYSPTVYKPQSGEIQYVPTPTPLPGKLAEGAPTVPMSVDVKNEHLFIFYGSGIAEYGSAAEGNPVIEEHVGERVESLGRAFALDATRGLIYVEASEYDSEREEFTPHIRVIELASPHKFVRSIDGSTLPGGKRGLQDMQSLAVDEGNGNVFVYEEGSASMVIELAANGEYISTVVHDFQPAARDQIGIDNGPLSPHGALGPDGRYLFVPSGINGIDHEFAFSPKPTPHPPVVEAASSTGVTQHEAIFHATVNPKGLQATYRFEYVSQQSFDVEGFARATVVGQGSLPPSTEAMPVSAPASGLVPGTAYRFRIVAENQAGAGEMERLFVTYPLVSVFGACPNEAVRSGPSASLPDCRAYELVTPPDTNGHVPFGLGYHGVYFPSRQASPDGGSVAFQVYGGGIPGFATTGTRNGDPYVAIRKADGWYTESTGPTGAETEDVLPGSASADQRFSFWEMAGADGGSAEIDGEAANYVRYPDGHMAPIGRGSLGVYPHAKGMLISENGAHIIFTTAGLAIEHAGMQLESNAPGGKTWAIYDRTPDEVTHVVSLLPGDVTPPEKENAEYQGASLDGRGVAFSIGQRLYLRYDDEETYEIGEGVSFEGVAEGGNRVFYLEGGNLMRFDAKTGETTRFSASGDVTPVNVASDGAVAYFVSPSVLASQPSPTGAAPQPGEENLYFSKEGTLDFVGTLTERDVQGEKKGGLQLDGLGLWTVAVSGRTGNSGSFGVDPSRTTPDGEVFLFEAQANLTRYDSQGHKEVYRYDETERTLTCLSCNPIGATTGEATLQSVAVEGEAPQPLNAFDIPSNLRADGRRVFFESTEALVLADVDGMRDVYEWEDQGVGSCTTIGGCVYLISSGTSGQPEYLFGVSDTGNDVFVMSKDLLVPWLDHDETPSIYDARVDGGFAPPASPPGECLGEACQPASPVVNTPTPASFTFKGLGGGESQRPHAKHKPRRGAKTHVHRRKHRRTKRRQHDGHVNRRAHR